jgi:predicted component of type VI protein secretion system
VARVLPSLHRVAGRADAVPLAFRNVFGLPVTGVRTVPGLVPLAASRQTRVGTANSRLGVDTVAGTGAVGVRRLEVTFGPVDLDTYREHALSDALRRQRDALYRLVVPSHLGAQVQERWMVGDPANPPRLGDTREAPTLGVNARLGEP